MKKQSVNSNSQTLLGSEFSTYQELVKKSALKPLPRNIHKLRIQIQKLLSTLEVISILTKTDLPYLFTNELKIAKKYTSRLRDLQLETAFLKGIRKKKLIHFKNHLIKKEGKAAKKTKSFLKIVPLGTQAQTVNLILDNLGDPKRKQSPAEATKTVDRFIKKSIHTFEKNRQEKNHNSPKILHSLRGKAKRLRYLGEAQASIFGKTQANIFELKKTQDTLGRVQNDRTLIKIINAYTAKKVLRKDGGVKRLKKKTSLNQKRLIESFING